MDETTKLLITVTIPSLISCSITLITLFLKSKWDEKNLHLSFKSKYKEIVLKQQIEYYEKFMLASWILFVKISEFLYDTHEDVNELIAHHKTLVTSVTMHQHIFPETVKNKMIDYQNAIQKALDFSVACKRPIELDKIEALLNVLDESRTRVIDSIKSSLFVE